MMERTISYLKSQIILNNNESRGLPDCFLAKRITDQRDSNYDDFGRLETIKDFNNNPVKSYEYNYKR